MSELTVTLPADLWLSANDRHHWAEKARRTKALRNIGYLEAKANKLGSHEVSHVAAFVGYPRNGRADPANAAPTTKALIDGMVDAGVWPDDDSTHVLGPTHLRDPSTKQAGVYSVRFVLTDQAVPW